jgi:hypothetical protein
VCWFSRYAYRETPNTLISTSDTASTLFAATAGAVPVAEATAVSHATAKMNASWAAFFGERYTETLMHAGVGNTDRLKKKVEKNLKFLVDHGFD